MKKVFVSGCYDLLHSGHVEFFRQASRFGLLYVGIGSDATILELKHHRTLYREQERLFMVRSIRYVHEAFINSGSGVLDFLPELDLVRPDILVVNSDGASDLKEQVCRERGIEYVVLERVPQQGLEARSSTALKEILGAGSGQKEALGAGTGQKEALGAGTGQREILGAGTGQREILAPGSRQKEALGAGSGNQEALGDDVWNKDVLDGTGKQGVVCRIPTRLDLAGTWIDQPYVSCFGPGWAITISLEPDFEIRERCGLSTSTRNFVKKIWPYELPDMDPETLARLVFCYENNPERSDGIISGAQDAIGICMPGLCRHYYDNCYWPVKFESCHDDAVLDWLEQHLVMVPMDPRPAGCSVVTDKDITPAKVHALTAAAQNCWDAILALDLDAFARAYRDSFNAQVAMFPAMIQGSVQSFIDLYSAMPQVLAWKMPGAGAGGYLALVVTDRDNFLSQNPSAIKLTIRRH